MMILIITKRTIFLWIDVTNRMMILRDHDEAVWTLFKNESAQDGSQNLLFSGSASGQILAFDLDRGKVTLFLFLFLFLFISTFDPSYD